MPQCVKKMHRPSRNQSGTPESSIRCSLMGRRMSALPLQLFGGDMLRMRRTLCRAKAPLALAALAAASLALTPFPATAQLDPGLLAGLKARSIGPATMSGRVTSIAGVESDPQVLYVGAASGGVWKSVNGGLTWKPIFDDQPVASIGAIAVDQANPDVVWVG